MRDFRQLLVWEKAHRLALASYAGTAKFPREELYGLTSQIRRCAASVAANIAEGAEKMEIPNSTAFCRLPRVLPANSSTTSCWPRTSPC